MFVHCTELEAAQICAFLYRAGFVLDAFAHHAPDGTFDGISVVSIVRRPVRGATTEGG